jgi:hypothetical protein
MATKTIGSGGGRDYSTVAAWITYLEALTFSGDEIGECYNDSEFVTSAELVFDSDIDNTGSQKVILRPASGQGFADHASAATNALRYNASNGVGIRITSGVDSVIKASIPRFEIYGMQLKKDTAYLSVLWTNGDGSSNTGVIVERCIIQGVGGRGVSWNATGEIRSTLILHNGANPGVDSSLGSLTMKNCTIVRSAAAATTGINRVYATTVIKNCAVFGFSTNFAGTISGNNNASDGSISFGSGNQASLTYASQFQVITSGSEDFRAVTSGSLDGNGANADAPTTDIINQTRPNPPAIGAWDFPSGGGGGGESYLISAMVFG